MIHSNLIQLYPLIIMSFCISKNVPIQESFLEINGIMVKVKFFLKSRTSKSNIFLQQLMEKERAIIQFGSITCVSRESSKTVLLLQKRTKKVGIRARPKDFPRNVFLIINFVFSQFR